MMNKDIRILRELCKQIAQIAAQPEQAQKKTLWQKLNGLKPERPMFMIDEMPWNELNGENELTLLCEDEASRLIETDLRRQIYRSRHIYDDYVFEPFLYVPKKIIGADYDPLTGVALDYGIDIKQNTIEHEEGNAVLAHEYFDQLETQEDLIKLRVPEIRLDEQATAKREEIAHAAADGILEVRMDGFTPWFAAWDYIIEWRGMEKIIFGMYDEPEFIHAIIQKILDISLA